MLNGYRFYLGSYFHCTEEAYKKWVMDDCVIREFDTVELEGAEGVAFVPYKWGIHLVDISDTTAISISSIPDEEIGKLNDEYKGIIPLFPDGVTTQYGLVTWWS